MRITCITLFIIICITEMLNAQSYCDGKYDYVWLLGSRDIDTLVDEHGGSEINFVSFPPILKRHPRLSSAPWQNSSMCDKNGQLIFYSNGCSIYNATDSEMINGDSLNPGEIYEEDCPLYGYSGAQNMISLPDLEIDSLYYVFHIDKIYNADPEAQFVVQSKHAYHTTIKISLEFPLGHVLEKNKILLEDTSMLGSPVSAVKTGNGLGWWVVTPDRWSNGFHTFKLENGDFTYLGKQYIGIPTDPDATGGQGKFSPNGKYFAWFHPKNGLFLYDFDRITGLFKNFSHIKVDNQIFIIGGCEFSPSSQYLYVNHIQSLYQVDLFAEDIQSTLTHIADYDGFGDPLPTRFFFMERTPDNRIFMNISNGSQYLHVIQEPNRKGVDCNFEQHAIKLPTINNFTLPHFPNYRLGPLEDSLCEDYVVNTNVVSETYEVGYSITPNPATDFIKINPALGMLDDISVSILDMNGKILINSNELYIDISQLHPGMYVCKLTIANNKVYISKLIVL